MKAPAIGFTPVPADGHNSRAPKYRWDGNPPRRPRVGEYYLSGAIPRAYKATHNLADAFYIAVPETDAPVTVAQLRAEIGTLHAMMQATDANPPAYQLRQLAMLASRITQAAFTASHDAALRED